MLNSSGNQACAIWFLEQAMGDEIRPFKIHVNDADLEDLKKRLRATRWPEPQTVLDWSQGVPLDYVQQICEYWASDYDWRKIEARLNALAGPQFIKRWQPISQPASLWTNVSRRVAVEQRLLRSDHGEVRAWLASHRKCLGRGRSGGFDL